MRGRLFSLTFLWLFISLRWGFGIIRALVIAGVLTYVLMLFRLQTWTLSIREFGAFLFFWTMATCIVYFFLKDERFVVGPTQSETEPGKVTRLRPFRRLNPPSSLDDFDVEELDAVLRKATPTPKKKKKKK